MANVSTIVMENGGFASLAANLAVIATATPLTGYVNTVTSADASNVAVALPYLPGGGGPIVVHSVSTDGLTVFPGASTVSINGATAGDAFTIGANKTAKFWQVSPTAVMAILGA